MKKSKLQNKWQKISNEPGWKPVSQKRFEEIKAAKEREKKEARFTARLSHSDFDGLKQIADRMGLGYQTLLGSIIHQYVNGSLISKEEVERMLRAVAKAG